MTIDIPVGAVTPEFLDYLDQNFAAVQTQFNLPGEQDAEFKGLSLVVADIDGLKALTSRPPAVLVQTGKAAGVWQWVLGSSTTADDALVVQCLAGLSGRYKRVYTGRAMIEWWGVVGGGVVSNTTALNNAIAAGVPISGAKGQVYGYTGKLSLVADLSMWDVALKQLAPGASLNVITIEADNVSNLDLRRITVDRNGDGTNGGLLNASGTNGALNSAFGIKITGGTGHHFEDLLVFGDDSGTGMLFRDLDKTSRVIRPVCRDMLWARTAAVDDQVQGIWFDNCRDLEVVSPKVFDLTGILNGTPTRRFTRGIPIGGCDNVTFYSALAYRCDQGIDITGGPATNTDLRLVSPVVLECFVWGIKLANCALRCIVTNGIAEGCGVGYVVSGNAALAVGITSDRNTFIDCVSLDSGASGQAVVGVAGFRVLSDGATEAGSGARTKLIRCKAIDRQTVKTMVYGFYTETPVADYSPTMIDCESIGHTVAATSGVFKSQINVVGTVSQSSGYITGAIVERGANADGEYIRFADGTQICTKLFDDTAGAWDDNATYGAAFFARSGPTDPWITWNFPIAFAGGSAPQVSALVGVDGVTSVCGASNRAINNLAAAITPWCSATKAAAVPKTLSLMAIGRWY